MANAPTLNLYIIQSLFLDKIFGINRNGRFSFVYKLLTVPSVFYSGYIGFLVN